MGRVEGREEEKREGMHFRNEMEGRRGRKSL